MALLAADVLPARCCASGRAEAAAIPKTAPIATTPSTVAATPLRRRHGRPNFPRILICVLLLLARGPEHAPSPAFGFPIRSEDRGGSRRPLRASSRRPPIALIRSHFV